MASSWSRMRAPSRNNTCSKSTVTGQALQCQRCSANAAAPASGQERHYALVSMPRLQPKPGTSPVGTPLARNFAMFGSVPKATALASLRRRAAGSAVVISPRRPTVRPTSSRLRPNRRRIPRPDLAQSWAPPHRRLHRCASKFELCEAGHPKVRRSYPTGRRSGPTGRQKCPASRSRPSVPIAAAAEIRASNIPKGP